MITRKEFVAGAAALGTAAVGARVASADEAQWDYESDLVVVGAGSSLFGVALAAHMGKTVTVLEKADILGGTSLTCGGGIWAPCNRWHEDYPEAEVVEYLKAGDLFEGSSDEAKADYVHNFHLMAEYTADEFGYGWDFWPGIGDYDKVPFSTTEGRTLWFADAEGKRMRASAYFTDVIIPQLEESGLVELVTGCCCKRLVQDPEGRVVGVEAEIDGRTVRAKGDTAVLLAAGGFDWNQEMVKKYLRGPLFGTRVAVTNTGDGIRMGQAVGCDLAGMQNTLGGNCFLDGFEVGKYFEHNMGYEFGSYRANAYAMLVNKRGRRFMDESTPYSNYPDAAYGFDTNDHTFTNIPAYLIWSEKHVELYGWPTGAESKPDWVGEFATIEELAEAYGINADNLAAEVERFNGFCDTGVDEDFSRGTNPWSYGQVPQVEGLANHCLGHITAPYYVCLVGPGSLGTKGGIKVDLDCRAVDVFGEVVPGLYASGTNAAAVLGWSYGGAGGGLGPGMYQSMKAVNHMFGLHLFDTVE